MLGWILILMLVAMLAFGVGFAYGVRSIPRLLAAMSEEQLQTIADKVHSLRS